VKESFFFCGTRICPIEFGAAVREKLGLGVRVFFLIVGGYYIGCWYLDAGGELF
jgi:hypothetical protein